MTNKLLITILLTLLITAKSYAAWNGPSVFTEGNWGDRDDEFGIAYDELTDKFPRDIFLLSSQVIVKDQINHRIVVYDLNGSLVEIDNLKFEDGKYTSNKYRIAGRYIYSINDYLYVYNSYVGEIFKQDIYLNYKISYKEKPLELGFHNVLGAKNDKKLHNIIFPNATYSILIDENVIKNFGVDTKGHLNIVSQGDGTTFVYKVDLCGNILGELVMPISKGHVVGYVGLDAIKELDAEYGSPLLAPNGDIYYWKRTPDTFSILKWEWVDDPSDPQGGPEPPSTLAVQASLDGLLLTWDASPQDPGCVDSYEVERATSSDGIYSSIGSTDVGILRYNDTSILPGETVYYKVRAKSGGEFSDYTAVASGKRL